MILADELAVILYDWNAGSVDSLPILICVYIADFDGEPVAHERQQRFYKLFAEMAALPAVYDQSCHSGTSWRFVRSLLDDRRIAPQTRSPAQIPAGSCKPGPESRQRCQRSHGISEAKPVGHRCGGDAAQHWRTIDDRGGAK
jgi:hypothetical protein